MKIGIIGVINVNILICGGTDFDDWEVFFDAVSSLSLFQEPKVDICILSAHDGGTSRLAEHFASVRGFQCLSFAREIKGKDGLITFIKYAEMLDRSDGIVIFWDGKNKDIEQVIRLAKLSNRATVVFDYYGKLIDNFTKL